MPRRPVVALTSIVLALTTLSACTTGSDDAPEGPATAGATGAAGCPAPSATPAQLPSERLPASPAEKAAMEKVTASGAVATDTAPSVHLGAAISVKETQQRVLTPGSGKAADRNSWVIARTLIFNGTTGKQVFSSWKPLAPFDSFGMSQGDMLPGMTRGLLGAQTGSRVLIAIPPQEGISRMSSGSQLGSPTDTLVVVADIKEVRDVPSELTGKMDQAGDGMPVVGDVCPGVGPSITIPQGAKAPSKTTSAVLIQGSGPEVKAGQKVVTDYKGVLWDGGKTFDASWARGMKLDFTVGTGAVIKAWDSQLVGKKVGSRVLVVATPQDAYGAQGTGDIPANATLVFVVDILDAH